MKASELRIGNLYDCHGVIKSVTPSVIQDVMESERIWCKPIPLTEELLLKCGFDRLRKDSNLFLDFTNDIYLAFMDNKLIGLTRNHYMDSDNQVAELQFDVNVKHLHQLQNLYFALTNNELNIEL